MNVCLKEVLGDEMVLYTVALLVPLGPGGVCKRAEEKSSLASELHPLINNFKFHGWTLNTKWGFA